MARLRSATSAVEAPSEVSRMQMALGQEDLGGMQPCGSSTHLVPFSGYCFGKESCCAKKDANHLAGAICLRKPHVLRKLRGFPGSCQFRCARLDLVEPFFVEQLADPEALLKHVSGNTCCGRSTSPPHSIHVFPPSGKS